jgi:hypothetical protein
MEIQQIYFHVKEDPLLGFIEVDTFTADYCNGVVSYKIFHELWPFSDLLCDPHLSSNHSWFICQSSLITAETSSIEVGSWQQMSLNLVDDTGIFNMK